jgi:hypothetical protein
MSYLRVNYRYIYIYILTAASGSLFRSKQPITANLLVLVGWGPPGVQIVILAK